MTENKIFRNEEPVCAAYRRDAYLAVGGFDTPIISNEDMLIAAKLLDAGCALAYAPDAAVVHSHRYSLAGELRRNIYIGSVMRQYRDRLPQANADAEGWRLLRFVGGELVRRGQYRELLSFYTHVSARFAGNRIGKLMEKRSRG